MMGHASADSEENIDAQEAFEEEEEPVEDDGEEVGRSPGSGLLDRLKNMFG